MNDDELTTIQEELAAAKAELEELQVGTADREARSAHLESELAEALAELATAQDTAKARDLELAGVSERTQALESQARDAAQRYRELALRGAPELPEELVAGGDGGGGGAGAAAGARNRLQRAWAPGVAGAGRASAGGRAASIGAGPGGHEQRGEDSLRSAAAHRLRTLSLQSKEPPVCPGGSFLFAGG